MLQRPIHPAKKTTTSHLAQFTPWRPKWSITSSTICPPLVVEIQMAALEALIVALTRQTAELLLRIPKQSHFEISQKEHREDVQNSRANDIMKTTFTGRITGGWPPGNKQRWVNFRRNWGGDVGDLGRKVVDLEKKCSGMAREMEKKEKGSTVMVDKLLLGSVWSREIWDYT
jgi:hypothetical protein